MRDVWNGWARFDAPAAMRNIRPNRTLQHILILSLLIFARPGDALFTTPLPRSIERDLSRALSLSLSLSLHAIRLTNNTGKEGGNSWERGLTVLQIVCTQLIEPHGRNASEGNWGFFLGVLNFFSIRKYLIDLYIFSLDKGGIVVYIN